MPNITIADVRAAAQNAAQRAQAEGQTSGPHTPVNAAIDAMNTLCDTDPQLPDSQRYEWIGRILNELRDTGMTRNRTN